jgi:hypothetical protein
VKASKALQMQGFLISNLPVQNRTPVAGGAVSNSQRLAAWL